MWLLSGYILVQLILGINSQDCRTEQGNNWDQKNVPCQFPFKYNGKEYYTCANMEFNGKQFQNYCATKLKNGNEIAGIGKCGPNCQRECLTIPDESRTGFESNKPCIFPFIGDGKTYNGCADVGPYKNFCATQVDSNGIAKKFGTCGNGCPRHGSQTASRATTRRPTTTTTTTTPPSIQKLTRDNYKTFKRTINQDDGRFLFGDGRDKCGRPASKFQNNLKP